jgi:hypothetical protein
VGGARLGHSDVTPYATIDDLEIRSPRTLTAAETDQVEVMLQDASFLLSVRVPGLQEAVESGDDVAYAAMVTTTAMVTRALLAQAAQQDAAPSVASVTQTYGPYTSSVSYRPDNGGLFLYDRELEYLGGLVGGNVAAAVSIRSPGS